jgi:hypothetical protein
VYLNLVEDLLWVQVVGGSNPLTPTIAQIQQEKDVALCGVCEDQAHGLFLPQRIGFGFGHERLEVLVGFELRTVKTEGLHTLFSGRAKQARTLGLESVALLERLDACEKYIRNAREAAGGDLRLREAGHLFGDLVGGRWGGT